MLYLYDICDDTIINVFTGATDVDLDQSCYETKVEQLKLAAEKNHTNTSKVKKRKKSKVAVLQ